MEIWKQGERKGRGKKRFEEAQALPQREGNQRPLRRRLRRNGQKEEAKEMCSSINKSENYEAALNIIGEYVNITKAKGYMDETKDNEIEME